MLPETATPSTASEPPWRAAVALGLGTAACITGLLCSLWPLPGLWFLATFDPEPIRPMGLVAGMMLCLMGGVIIGCGLSAAALRLSHHRLARRVANAGIVLSTVPALNLVLFLLIIFVRHLHLGD